MTQPSPNLISVLRDSHDCVGFLRSAGFQAYGDAGRSVALSILMTPVARDAMQKNLERDQHTKQMRWWLTEIK
jgi:hypothetical protein